MNKQAFSKITAALLLLSFAIFQACEKGSNSTGKMQLEITDGPIDDANVKGVFVTVADVKIDGKSWSGFKGKTTIDLMAYQKGQTKLLGEGELEAQAYNQIVLVLDTETDAAGNAPGCYVLDAQNVKKQLSGGANFEITVKGDYEIESDQTQQLILDFDLRKSLGYAAGGTTQFTFASAAELSSAIRLFVKAETGTIKGVCNDLVSGSEKIVVYAYKKGTYNVNVEKQGQGTANIQFANAVNSAVVANDGSFQLSFVHNGDYELHFIGYEDTNNDGTLEAKGELIASLNGELDLLGLLLSAAVTLNLNVLVTGMIDF